MKKKSTCLLKDLLRSEHYRELMVNHMFDQIHVVHLVSGSL